MHRLYRVHSVRRRRHLTRRRQAWRTPALGIVASLCASSPVAACSSAHNSGPPFCESLKSLNADLRAELSPDSTPDLDKHAQSAAHDDAAQAARTAPSSLRDAATSLVPLVDELSAELRSVTGTRSLVDAGPRIQTTTRELARPAADLADYAQPHCGFAFDAFETGQK